MSIGRHRATADLRHTATLGVLGGGQLGRMLALAGAPLGVRFRFLDPDPDAPAGDVGELIVGRFDDAAALSRFAEGLDAITYEFENVPAATARWLAAQRPGIVSPPPNALAVAQDRLEEKRAFERAGLAVPAYAAVSSVDELRKAIEGPIGLPCVLKTRRMGYDGKGQAVIRSHGEIGVSFEDVARHLRVPNGSPEQDVGRAGESANGASGVELLVEAFVPFAREVSAICVRGAGGETHFYPLTENTHSGGILRTSIAPATGPESVTFRQIRSNIDRLLADMEYRGVLAIELFVVEEGKGGVRMLGNEMAPRVHNSGHWTMDGSVTGQFENHVRAVLGWPIGSTSHLPVEGSGTVWGMVNLIGGPIPDPASMPREPWMRLHLYGKAARRGRKIGHINACAVSRADLERRIGWIRGSIPAATAD
ncbi:MAG: 5-(carboxyamino)imidazole ribonucleotide synthase [Phycisphaeraceae bacterium]|nr:5-(carboxyamino)imidazole ribonucleotide synthase [Phycisphaeraceae bacterium]